MRQILCSRIILRLVRALAFAIAITGGPACNAPPIASPDWVPLPPPVIGPPTVETDSAGLQHTYWKVEGKPTLAMSNLWVYLNNLEMDSGVSAKAAADGSYETRIEGQEGDRIHIGAGATDSDITWTMCRRLYEGPANVLCQ
jgi:hypothetical protein